MAPRLQLVNGMQPRGSLQAQPRRVVGAVIALWVLLLGVLIAPSDTARAAESSKREALTVLAAASLKESFEQLRTEFHRQNPDVEINLMFGGTQELRTQIEHGASVDVFASADVRNMDMLQARGLIHRPEIFAYNELVIVVPNGNPAGIQSLADLTKAKRIAIGSDDVPVGRYTTEMLTRASRVQGPQFKSQVLGRVESRDSDVRRVLARVASGEADAGIVYKTDVTTMADKVEAIGIPAPENVIASYPIVAVKSSQSPEAAAKFIAYVHSAPGQRALAQHGFQPAERLAPHTDARERAPQQPDQRPAGT